MSAHPSPATTLNEALRAAPSEAAVGPLTLRPLDPLKDAELLHTWVTHPKAAFWMMQDATPEDVERAYLEIAADEHHHALLGLHDGEPAFLMEYYDPAHRELVGLYPPQPGTGGEQVAGVFDRLKAVLARTGSDFRHLAKATYYVSADDASRKLNELRPRYYDPKRPPAASKAVVPGVGMAGRTVTLDMIAVPK